MEYVRLGNTGLKVSRLCLGCMSFGSSQWQKWVLEEEASLAIIKRAWDLGINFFDTADVYSNGESERILGEAIRKYNIPRDQIVIATKVHFYVSENPANNTLYMPQSPLNNATQKGLSRKKILSAIDESLKRLGTDYVDIYQVQRWDYDTPIEETMEALHDVVKSGKARYLGASSMHAWQFAKAQYTAKMRGWTPFVSMQDLYNLLYREEEREMIPLCRDLGVGLIPWSPLARGLLSGKTRDESVRGSTDMATKKFFLSQELQVQLDEQVIQRVKQIAEKHKMSASQIAIAWLFSKPIVCSPIIGTTKIDQLEELVHAVSFKVPAEDIAFLEELYHPRPIVGYV